MVLALSLHDHDRYSTDGTFKKQRLNLHVIGRENVNAFFSYSVHSVKKLLFFEVLNTIMAFCRSDQQFADGLWRWV